MLGRNDTGAALVVRLVVPAPDEDGDPTFVDYLVPPGTTRQIPAPQRPPDQAVIYDESCTVLFVAFFSDQSGSSFDAGGQLYRQSDLAAGYTTERLKGDFPAADRDPRCAGVFFDPTDF